MLKNYLSKLLAFLAVILISGTALAQVEIIAPASIAGVYDATNAAFGPYLDGQSAEVLLADDGAGVTNGCDPIANDLTGAIALIDRGACAFTTKAANAEAAGAIAVIVCNNNTDEPDATIIMGNAPTDPLVCNLGIPAVMISYNDCQTIKAELINGVTATLEAETQPMTGEDASTAIPLPDAGTYTAPMLTGTFPLLADATAAQYYTITAPMDGIMNVNSCLGGADTRVAVLQGCRNAFVLHGENDDACEMSPGGDPYASDLTVLVNMGEEYIIYWDNRWDDSGFDFTVSFGPYPMVDVTFNVDMSQQTVAGDGVKLILDGGAEIDMNDDGDGTWSYTASLTAADQVDFRYANGSGNMEDNPDLVDCRTVFVGLDAINIPDLCYNSCEVCPAPVSCDDVGIVFCDNFDDYATGSTTGGQSPWWSTWSGTLGGAEDGIVTDEQAFSAPNSMLIAEGQSQDVLLLLGERMSGSYRLSWKMYIPAGATGYFNIQEEEAPGVQWNLDVFFNLDGGAPGTGTVDQTGTTFAYPEDMWFDVALVHDLDNDRQALFVDGELVEVTDYPDNLGSIDFFSIDADNRYYIDDLKFVELPTCGDDALICDNLEFYAPGSRTGDQAAWWSTWSGSTGGADDGLVTDEQAYSGAVSMLIAEGQTQDVILLLGNRTEGSYRLSWQEYIPAGATGYFNIQEDEAPGVAWNLDVFFNEDGGAPGTATVDQTGTTFSYPEDEWFEVALVHDLDNDRQALFINGEKIEETTYDGSLGAINFFSIDADNRYYIDDVSFVELPSCANPDALVCDNLEFYADSSRTGGQAPWWGTWSGNLGGIDDGLVTTEQAESGAKSMLIAEGQTQDVLLLLGNQTDGNYRLSWDMYVTPGATAYYNIQEDETPGVDWNLDLEFNEDALSPGEGFVRQTNTTFTYPEGEWFTIEHIVNLDNNTLDLYVNGVLVEDDYDYPGSLGAVNFFSIDAFNHYYVDNLLFEALPAPGIDVVFQVDLTYYLQNNPLETVKIAGNFMTNGASVPDWDPTSSPAFVDLGDDVWSTTVTFPSSSAGQELQYKFLNTADSWGDCGVEQECLGDEDAACKDAGSDNRLLVIPDENSEVCFTWETCFGCNVVSVQEPLLDIPMSIAPNPFSDQTVVTFNAPILDATAHVTALTGQLVRTYRVNGTQLVIEKDDLRPGIYFLNVVTEDGTSAAEKLIVE